MTGKFDVAGTSFSYPENWTVTEEEGASPNRCVTLQSPESGFWMLQVYDESLTPEEVSAQVLRSVRQEYEDVEITEVHQSFEATETVGYDLEFYYLDFVIAARVRSFELPGHTCAVLCQAEDREFDRSWPVFQAITTSLLRNV